MKHRVSISTNGAGHGSFHLDGSDISGAVRGFSYSCEVGHQDKIEVELGIVEGHSVESSEAEIIIPDDTRKTLKQLGWTPPEDG